MSIFRTTIGGNVYNGKLNGGGILLDNANYNIKKGNFSNDKLHGDNCISIMYNVPVANKHMVIIACGTFIKDNKDGLITFYTFEKSFWIKMFLKTIVAKKCIHVYKNNVFISIHEPNVNVCIRGNCVFDDGQNTMHTFAFKEVEPTLYLKMKKYFFASSNT